MGVWWSGGQVKLAPEVLLVIISNQKQFQNLRLQNEQNNELKAWINLVDKLWTLHSYWASNILVGAAENWNALDLNSFFLFAALGH